MLQNILGPSFIFQLVAIVVSLVIHEFAHAWTANRLGDPTAKLAGRVTLNPLAHLELLGLIMILFAPIGWAKPTPVNSSNFRHPRSSLILVVLAGPLSNLALGILCLVGLKWIPQGPGTALGDFVPHLLYTGFLINVSLFVFNLIPIPPLDGSRIVENLIPYRWARGYQKFELYGPFLLLLVVIIPPLQNAVLRPLLLGTAQLVYNIFG